ncbi:MAG TPA: trigger factor [bacterium]|nr:trigger factor [bacterium]
MRVTAASREGEQQTLDVELSPKEVDEEFGRAYNRYRKSVIAPGFRPGKALNSAVQRKFGSKVKQEVRESLLKAYSMLATQEQNIPLIDSPKVESLVPLEESKPFAFRLNVRANFVPEVRGYDRIHVRIAPAKQVTPEQVDEMIERLRESFAVLRPVEGPDVEVKVGNRITVDAAFLGRENDEVIVSAPGESVEVLSAETRLYGQHLVGRRSEEEAVGDYTVPDDFPDEALRGRQVRASVKVKEIKKLNLPPLDDSFAEMVGETQTLEELRNLLEHGVQDKYDREHQQMKEQAMLDRLLECNPLEVHPKVLKSRTVRMMIGMVEEGLLNKEHSEDEFEAIARKLEPVVLDTLKRELLVSQVALQEGIDATQDEIDGVVKHSGLRPRAERNAKDYLIERFRITLMARAKVIDVKTIEFLLTRLECELITDTAGEQARCDETEGPQQAQ